MINSGSIAFDIDGVVANTMKLFLDIAREEFNINSVRYEDITCYMLEECIDIEPEIIEAIIKKLLDKDYTAYLEPMPDAPDVLTKLGKQKTPLLFVTARPYIGAIHDWIQNILPLEPSSTEVIATGSFEAKADVLLSKGISCFVEDRLETCFQLQSVGITPVLFKQPWNRQLHPFQEVSTWRELESLIEF